jgi:hypothetical protein
MGARTMDATTSASSGMNQIAVGGTVTFRAGFKGFRDATTSAIAWSNSVTDYTFRLLDSASSGAIVLTSTVGAVILSIAAISF